MRKINAKIVSIIPGGQFIHYFETKTLKELYRYAYSQLRLFAQKGGDYSFCVIDLDSHKPVLWLHGFKSNVVKCYAIYASHNNEPSKELFKIPLA